MLTGALLLNAALQVRCRVLPRLELRGSLLALTIYWNELWIPSWEPALGLGFRF